MLTTIVITPQIKIGVEVSICGQTVDYHRFFGGMVLDFKQLDKQIEDYNPDNKLELYQLMKNELKNGEKSDILWRLSKISLIISGAADNQNKPEISKQFIEEALQYSKRSIELDPNNVKCHKWYCASVGKMTKHVSIKQKIQFGQIFKKHVDIAIKLDPKDYLLHYMLGRFCYELSSLSWVERKIANTVFGTIPTTSYEEALKELIACDRLKPQWKDNYFWVAKTLIAMKRNEHAKKWVNLGIGLKNKNILDELSHNNLIKLKTEHKF